MATKTKGEIMSDTIYLEVKAILDTLNESNEKCQRNKASTNRFERTEAVVTQQYLARKVADFIAKN
jgi:hypothetical protein